MAPSTNVDEIKLEDIDFHVVKECTDKKVLKRYIKLLEDDGNYFVDLLKACKEKLREVSPKEYYLLYPVATSQEEIDEVTRDLLDWETSVKETDDALRKSKKDLIWDDSMGKVRAPVRGQESIKARPNLPPKENQGLQSKKQLADKNEAYARDKTNMKDYYKAWDNIDVDKMEEKMEQEEREMEEARQRHFEDLKDQQSKAHAASPIEVWDVTENIPQAHKKHMADTEKEKGNEAFYAKDYEEAEAYYSRSLKFCADDCSTWANRALVRLKLEKLEAALQDCEESLRLNPRYMKALHRKGKALHELKQYEDAVHCFQAALAVSPGNTQINGDLMIARRKLRSEGPAQDQRTHRLDDKPNCMNGNNMDGNQRNHIGNNSDKTIPEPCYTRVQIEEDSDTDSDVDVQVQDHVGSGGVAGTIVSDSAMTVRTAPENASMVFHTVQIEDESDDGEDEPEQPVLAESEKCIQRDLTNANANCPKVDIIEERGSAVGAFAPTSQEPKICFDDMD